MGHKTIEARGRLGSATRRHRNDPHMIEAARRDLAAAKLEEFIERTLATAPPLTPEQRQAIARLLTPAGAS